MSSARVVIKPETLPESLPENPVEPRLGLAELQQFVEHEVALLDEQRFEEWLNLFADDGAYWVPAKQGQESPFNHVSLFYDDKHTLTIRVQRLHHPPIHSQIPRSKTVRLVANFKLENHDADPSLYRVTSKFVMLEDRPGYGRRLFGGRYAHVLRRKGDGLEIVLKRVDLTNCDHSFPALTQPF
jgi:3-phenylpropionate/cinnamic acid dioxygenase small subunit